MEFNDTPTAQMFKSGNMQVNPNNAVNSSDSNIPSIAQPDINNSQNIVDNSAFAINGNSLLTSKINSSATFATDNNNDNNRSMVDSNKKDIDVLFHAVSTNNTSNMVNSTANHNIDNVINHNPMLETQEIIQSESNNEGLPNFLSLKPPINKFEYNTQPQISQYQLKQIQQAQEAQIQAQIQAQVKSQQSQSHLYSIFDQSSTYEKDNPLFTLANSVPFIASNSSDVNADLSKTNFLSQNQNQLEIKQIDNKPKNNLSQRSSIISSSNDWINQLYTPLPISNSVSNTFLPPLVSNLNAIPNNSNSNNSNSNNNNNNITATVPTTNSNHNNQSTNLSFLNYDINSTQNLLANQTDIFSAPINSNSNSMSSNNNLNNAQFGLIKRPPPEMEEHKGDNGKIVKIFKCNFTGCGKVFSRAMNYNSHYESVHRNQKRFVCSICQKQFARMSDQKRHEKTQHDPKEIYICGGMTESGVKWGCGRKFKRKDGLKAHWKSLRAKRKCLENITTLEDRNEIEIKTGIIDTNENLQQMSIYDQPNLD